MKKSKLIVLIMVVFSLSLGGCSFFYGQSAKKQEMIQIAESKKMKVAIENMLKKLDPKALMICTLFTGHPVRRVFSCVTVMSIS